MANWRLNRLWFWILAAVYFPVKILLGHSVVANLDGPQSFAGVLDTWLVIALAFVIGARLNDAGINRGIGIGLTFVITVILPIALLFGYIAVFGKPAGATDSKQEFIDLFGMISLVPLASLIALLIWAGTRPGKPAPQVSAATR
jgi:hypothetical protein